MGSEAVAVAGDVDDGAAMQEPVEHGCHCRGRCLHQGTQSLESVEMSCCRKSPTHNSCAQVQRWRKLTAPRRSGWRFAAAQINRRWSVTGEASPLVAVTETAPLCRLADDRRGSAAGTRSPLRTPMSVAIVGTGGGRPPVGVPLTRASTSDAHQPSAVRPRGRYETGSTSLHAL